MRQYTAVALVLGGILVGACVPNPFTAKETNAETPAQPTKWEYNGIPTNINGGLLAALREAGNEGWELVGVINGDAYIKRPKP